jgi:hypothetical protein
MRYHRVGAEQKTFHPTKHRGIGANAQSQAKDRQQSKARAPSEHPQGEAEILKQGLEERQAAGFAVVFHGLLLATEANQGLAASFVSREATPKILLYGQVEMRRHFRLKFAVLLGAVEEGTYAMEPLVKAIGHFSLLPSCHFRLRAGS